MGKKVLLLHGFNSSSKSYFFPALFQRYKDEHEIYVVDCPNPASPDIDVWTETVLDLKQKNFDLIVAHSLGGTLALSMLTRELITCRTLMTIGSSHGPKHDISMNSFLKYLISFETIRKLGTDIIVVHSFDDPWTHPEYGILLVKQSRGHGIFYADKGHFEMNILPKEVLQALDTALNI